MRKMLKIGTVAAGLALMAIHPAPVVRLVESAQNFHHYFHDLKGAGANPLERFLFSLALANTQPGHHQHHS